jgi:hypothetical protein
LLLSVSLYQKTARYFLQDVHQCFLGAFAKLQKATASFVLSACLSVRMEKLCCRWIYFHKT